MTVQGNGDLPEGEGACVNVAETGLPVLDSLFESANGFGVRNFDKNNLGGVISEE